jgi:hypothetical protein
VTVSTPSVEHGVLAGSGVSVASFDVMDTVLVRRICNPRSLFVFVGRAALEAGLLDLTPDLFGKLRTEAEQLARIGIPDGETDLRRIYGVFARIACIPAERLEALMDLEMHWEDMMLSVAPGAHERVNAAREAGHLIHFISEMYLPATFLENALRKRKLMEGADEIWVSGEHAASKTSGRLFSILCRERKIIPGQIHHTGNDWTADVVTPGKMGIATTHVPAANPTRYESLFEQHAQASNGWASLLAGAGRMLRLQPAGSERSARLRAIVGNVIGPGLGAYVLWVLRHAVQGRLKRLYFVSRDGYVPYLMARQWARTLAPGLECRYLYGSRQAWHLAGLESFDADAWNWLLEQFHAVNCGSFLKRIEVSWEECQQLAPELAAVLVGPDEPLTVTRREAFAETLRAGGALADAVLAKAKAKRSLVRDYAAEQGLLDGVACGLVEMGWSGKTRASFERVLGPVASASLRWFYLGIRNEARIHDSQRVQYFLHGPGLPQPELLSMPAVVESFCLAPHGSVTGYHAEAGKLTPDFVDRIEKALDSWGRAEILAAVEEFAEKMPLTCAPFPAIGNLADATRELFKAFSLNPSPEEARLWGSMPFENDQAAEAASVLAPEARVNLGSLRAALVFGCVHRACMAENAGAWGPGSWAGRQRSLLPLTIASWIGWIRVHGPQTIRNGFRRVLRGMRKLGSKLASRFR